jgi:hypothetical protein
MRELEQVGKTPSHAINQASLHQDHAFVGERFAAFEDLQATGKRLHAMMNQYSAIGHVDEIGVLNS